MIPLNILRRIDSDKDGVLCSFGTKRTTRLVGCYTDPTVHLLLWRVANNFFLPPHALGKAKKDREYRNSISNCESQNLYKGYAK